MRYLYGDSAPFPLGYNFLTTLESFMTAATRIVQLDQDASNAARQHGEVVQGRVKGLEALEAFHNVVMRAVQETAQKVQHAYALDYARGVADYASRYVEEHRRTATSDNDREVATSRSEKERTVAEQRTLLDGFLKLARLPVVATKYSLRLSGDGKDAHYTMNAVFDNPDGIQTSFALATSKAPAWSGPKKVSEFAEDMNLSVGIDKSWLRGTVAPKQVSVDEWIITEFDLSDEAFELHIKRKLNEKEELVFHLQRTDVGVSGMVEHPGVPEADQLPGNLAGQDLAHVERLWQALRLAARDLVDHKEQLLSVHLDGQPVFEGSLVVPFVVRLVTMFAPTVQEIAKRSSNEFELSLKMESDGGRREELYLRKEQITNRLQPLTAQGRQVFAPLGLDTWVPGLTQTPPPVSAAPPPVPSSSRVLPQS